LEIIRLVAELAECCHPAIDPVILRLVGRNVEHQHEVGGMSGGAECAAARTCLVDGTAVDRAGLEVGGHTRLEPDLRQSVVEDLGQ